ncbi:MAG TPA: ATP-binding protein [Gammaproteobacteria bacterium]|nr:ATP-binding protein [Gammaproteobacteria bacterium]
MHYYHRILEDKLKEYLTYFSVISLTGPRQSGKSTLLLHCLKNYQYVTFDDYKIVNLFHQDPERFMNLYANKVIFDEVQKVPELFNYVKLAVDKDRNNKGKFVLTGSSQFAFIKNLSESLAGRIGLLSLLPFQFSEITKDLREESIFRGGYPELVDQKYRYFEPWFSSYLETYINKDVAAIGHIGDMRDFRRLIHLLAINTAQQLNMSRYASDIGVDVKTIKRWIAILEASYIIFLLPPFYQNKGKRIVKSPKIYFYDTGLVAFLTGIDSKSHFEKGPMVGSLFENYLISDILKKECHQKTSAELFYLRTSHGVEVDLVIDRKRYREFIEIKYSETFNPRMVIGIETFIEKNDKGYLLYRGKKFPYHKPIEILNYREYLA